MSRSDTQFKKGHQDGFKKGYTPWNKGKKLPEGMLINWCGRMPWNKNKKLTKEHINKLVESHKGIFASEETKKKMGENNWMKKHSGDKNPQWKGGKSFEPYSTDWTRTLKLAIRQRDNFTCQKCGMTEEESLKKYKRVLSVNHIDFDKKNCNPENLNTLCCGCNTAVNINRSYWTNYFMEKLTLQLS